MLKRYNSNSENGSIEGYSFIDYFETIDEESKQPVLDGVGSVRLMSSADGVLHLCHGIHH